MKTTKKQQLRIDTLTKRYGMNNLLSSHETDNDGTSFYYFKSAYGSGFECIQRDGKTYNSNLLK